IIGNPSLNHRYRKGFYSLFKTLQQNQKKNYNKIGIVDKDYGQYQYQKNIFSIDFYSIENVSLIFCTQFDDLKRQLSEFVDYHGMEFIRLKNIIGDFKYNKEIEECDPFQLVIKDDCHVFFHDYINSNITDLYSFFRYKDLKKVIEKYSRFYKSKYGKSNYRHYIHDLLVFLPDNSIKHIMTNSSYKELKKCLFYDEKARFEKV
ncbi:MULTISPECIES: hypothetical protein, partial [Enterococcus]